MAVGGALGIAVGADAPAAAVVAGGGGSNPGTSQDQRPRVSAIGAAAAGNPRSRRGFGGGGRGRRGRGGAGGDGGGRRREGEGDARLYSIYRFEWGEGASGGQGPEIFPLSHFVLFLPLGRPRLGRGSVVESFSASVSVRFWLWFEIGGSTGGGQRSEVVMGVTAWCTRCFTTANYHTRY